MASITIDPEVSNKIQALITHLKRLEPAVAKPGQQDLVDASKLLVAVVQSKTPVGQRPHSRYKGQKKRSRRGNGQIVATYQPGNLKRSFRTLRFRRSEAVFVGPKLGGKLADGYYAHMVEQGTVHQRAQYFVKSAYDAAGAKTLDFAVKLLEKRIASHLSKI